MQHTAISHGEKRSLGLRAGLPPPLRDVRQTAFVDACSLFCWKPPGVAERFSNIGRSQEGAKICIFVVGTGWSGSTENGHLIRHPVPGANVTGADVRGEQAGRSARLRSQISNLDLATHLDDRVVWQIQERGGGARVVVHVRKQLFAPG